MEAKFWRMIGFSIPLWRLYPNESSRFLEVATSYRNEDSIIQMVSDGRCTKCSMHYLYHSSFGGGTLINLRNLFSSKWSSHLYYTCLMNGWYEMTSYFMYRDIEGGCSLLFIFSIMWIEWLAKWVLLYMWIIDTGNNDSYFRQ